MLVDVPENSAERDRQGVHGGVRGVPGEGFGPDLRVIMAFIIIMRHRNALENNVDYHFKSNMG